MLVAVPLDCGLHKGLQLLLGGSGRGNARSLEVVKGIAVAREKAHSFLSLILRFLLVKPLLEVLLLVPLLDQELSLEFGALGLRVCVGLECLQSDDFGGELGSAGLNALPSLSDLGKAVHGLHVLNDCLRPLGPRFLKHLIEVHGHVGGIANLLRVDSFGAVEGRGGLREGATGQVGGPADEFCFHFC